MTTISKILDDVLKNETRFFVDIGASCYSDASETEALMNNGWSGIMFECDPNKYQIQNSKIKKDGITILPDKVTPENILDILEKNNIPDGFFLSLDIDGYDYYVLDKILSKYKPNFIVSEINEKIPPTVKFSVQYNPDYFWDGSHYFGYSLGMLESLLTKYGYMIKLLDYNNVVLIRGNQTENLTTVYNEGYLNRPDRPSIFYYNADFNPIYTMNKVDQLKFIDGKFKPFSNERQATQGHQIDGKPITYRNYALG